MVSKYQADEDPDKKSHDGIKDFKEKNNQQNGAVELLKVLTQQ